MAWEEQQPEKSEYIDGQVNAMHTEAYDRGAKFRRYRKNPVLEDYLLVSSTGMEVDWYHKTEIGEWLLINYQPGDTIELNSINFSFAIEQLYRGIVLTPDS